jgi:hypothetical protein
MLIVGALNLNCNAPISHEISPKPPEITSSLPNPEKRLLKSNANHFEIELTTDWLREGAAADSDLEKGILVLAATRYAFSDTSSDKYIVIYADRDRRLSINEHLRLTQGDPGGEYNVSKPTKTKVDNQEAYRFVTAGKSSGGIGIYYIFKDGDSIWTIEYHELNGGDPKLPGYLKYENEITKFDEMVQTFQVTGKYPIPEGTGPVNNKTNEMVDFQPYNSTYRIKIAPGWHAGMHPVAGSSGITRDIPAPDGAYYEKETIAIRVSKDVVKSADEWVDSNIKKFGLVEESTKIIIDNQVANKIVIHSEVHLPGKLISIAFYVFKDAYGNLWEINYIMDKEYLPEEKDRIAGVEKMLSTFKVTGDFKELRKYFDQQTPTMP